MSLTGFFIHSMLWKSKLYKHQHQSFRPFFQCSCYNVLTLETPSNPYRKTFSIKQFFQWIYWPAVLFTAQKAAEDLAQRDDMVQVFYDDDSRHLSALLSQVRQELLQLLNNTISLFSFTLISHNKSVKYTGTCRKSGTPERRNEPFH